MHTENFQQQIENVEQCLFFLQRCINIDLKKFLFSYLKHSYLKHNFPIHRFTAKNIFLKNRLTRQHRFRIDNIPIIFFRNLNHPTLSTISVSVHDPHGADTWSAGFRRGIAGDHLQASVVTYLCSLHSQCSLAWPTAVPFLSLTYPTLGCAIFSATNHNNISSFASTIHNNNLRATQQKIRGRGLQTVGGASTTQQESNHKSCFGKRRGFSPTEK